jgi:glycosyltransferase involved in cell wall biosynthesis
LGWKKQLINAARHIIAISENTRKDVIEYYQVSPQKVTTVYLAGGFEPAVREKPAVPEMASIPERFILFVGSRSSYKNFSGFVKEVAPVIQANDISLVVAGGGPMGGGELSQLKDLGILDRTISFSHVSDVFLSQLYSKAIVFIFPSLYEGFGLPVLEAMQCDCPALLSNNSSLPEVGGDAARYFDPFTEGSLRNRLSELLGNPGEIEQMKAAGRNQVTKFNWDATTAGHVEVYKNILG